MHSWQTVQALFDVAPNTLWRWCRRASIIPHISPDDNRCRYLDNSQLLKLARLHKRVLVVDTDHATIDYLVQLERRIEELEEQANKKPPSS